MKKERGWLRLGWCQARREREENGREEKRIYEKK